MLLSLTTVSMTSCVTSTTVTNDYCVLTKPHHLTIEGLRVYDCLCSDKPVNPECR